MARTRLDLGAASKVRIGGGARDGEHGSRIVPQRLGALHEVQGKVRHKVLSQSDIGSVEENREKDLEGEAARHNPT